jgi:hypothetical protein
MATALLAGCSSSSSSPAKPVSSTGNSSSASSGTSGNGSQAASPRASATAAGGTATLAACATSALRVTVDAKQSGGAAGSTYVPIDFTNTSPASCEMYGSPGVSFVTAEGGPQLGAAAARVAGIGAVTVVLHAGTTAHAWLQVAEAGNYPSSICHPVTAHWLRVFPPGETAAAYVEHSFAACSSAKAAILTVYPTRSGEGLLNHIP